MRATPIEAGADITLHPRRAADAPEMFALVERSRADLREWLPWVDGTHTLADIRRYAQYSEAQAQSHVAFDYAVRFEHRLVGAIGLHAIDWNSRSTAIGYWLAPEARGRGIVTCAARAVVRYAFDTLELHRLEIRCVVENTASRSVAERLGFAFEGTLAEAYYLHGRFRDLALYATTVTRAKRAPNDY